MKSAMIVTEGVLLQFDDHHHVNKQLVRLDLLVSTTLTCRKSVWQL